jgi:hypothetical protein
MFYVWIPPLQPDPTCRRLKEIKVAAHLAWIITMISTLNQKDTIGTFFRHAAMVAKMKKAGISSEDIAFSFNKTVNTVIAAEESSIGRSVRIGAELKATMEVFAEFEIRELQRKRLVQSTSFYSYPMPVCLT